MCGRFTLMIDPADLQEAFPGLTSIPNNLAPRYNIAPTQPIAIIINTGTYTLGFSVWGLVPSWAKDPSIGSQMINARAETIAIKPAFRSAFRRHRCLIPADGFYEWQKDLASNKKTPFYISLQSRQPFTFAGIWDTWSSPDGSNLQTCCIITTQPNELVAPIHNRMPVILPSTAYQQWLDPLESRAEVLLPLLKPYPASEMQAYPVSRLVNAAANDSPDCVRPAQA